MFQAGPMDVTTDYPFAIYFAITLSFVLVMVAGPACWGKSFPQALGQKQSPVNIIRAQVQPDPVLLERPIKYNYAVSGVIRTLKHWTKKLFFSQAEFK